jgi:hypothetical protein
MKRNVMSWNDALAQGYQPRLYSYQPADIPAGDLEATLDFKIWSKWASAVSCYFTPTGSDRKFQLTVFRDFRTGQYCLKGTDIDFTVCPVKEVYAIRVNPNGKGRMVFEYAELIRVG